VGGGESAMAAGSRRGRVRAARDRRRKERPASTWGRDSRAMAAGKRRGLRHGGGEAR
jgi:hypothetical protein